MGRQHQDIVSGHPRCGVGEHIQDATRPNGFDWVDGSKADWARHSNRIAFCGHKVGEQVFLWILDLDTMNFSKILGPIQYGNAQPSWSPDDSKLVFRQPGGLSYKNELWTLDLNTGVQTFLAEVGKQQNDLYEPDWRRF